MGLVMIRIILRTIDAHPTVAPSCFVDDLSAEMTGPDDHILRELGGFIRHVAWRSIGFHINGTYGFFSGLTGSYKKK